MTAALASGTGPLDGNDHRSTLSGGVATFTDLADDTAETITLEFTGGGLTSPASGPIVVSPGPAAKLVIQTQPSSTATAGNPFATPIVIDEEDQYGNLETGDNSTVVTASLASGAGTLEGNADGHRVGRHRHVHRPRRRHGRDDHAGIHGRRPDFGRERPDRRQPGGGQRAGDPHAAVVDGDGRQPFATQPVIDEEDQYGNLETGDNSTVITARLATGDRSARRGRPRLP